MRESRVIHFVYLYHQCLWGMRVYYCLPSRHNTRAFNHAWRGSDDRLDDAKSHRVGLSRQLPRLKSPGVSSFAPSWVAKMHLPTTWWPFRIRHFSIHGTRAPDLSILPQTYDRMRKAHSTVCVTAWSLYVVAGWPIVTGQGDDPISSRWASVLT